MQKQHYFPILLLFFQFTFNYVIEAQEGWFWQNPDPQGNTLQAVSFSDADHGTAVGSYGTIIHTTDGGNTWINQESRTMEMLRGVSFTDENNGIVVGESGIILNTKDGGKTWNFKSSGTTETLYDVSFSDANNGTAVGFWTSVGTVYRTTDGGNTWTPQQTSIAGSYGVYLSVSFTDANNGTIVGNDGNVEHTTDGGNTWFAQNSNTTHTLNAISFLDVNNGIAVGSSGTVITTTDAGANWTLMQVTENTLYDASYTDIDNCLIVGKNATVVLVTEGGTTWTRYYQVGEDDFYGASLNTLVGTKGQIFRTTDVGTTWDEQRKGSVKRLKDVSFSSSNIGTAVGDNGTILRTTNGGSNWTSQTYNSPTTNGSINDYLKAVTFLDSNNGFAVSGDKNSDGSIFSGYGLILHTTNGGSTWSVSYSNTKNAFNGISIINTNNIVAVGIYKHYEDPVYVDRPGWSKSTDGGDTWNGWYFTSRTDPFTDVTFITDNVGFMVGYGGTILKSTDGASNWNSQNSKVTENLHGVCFTDENTGTVVGENGTILHTINSGLLWTAQSGGTTEDLYSVHFTDSNHGKVVGSNGTILYTTNGGTIWEKQSVCTDEDLFAVFFLDDNTGNVVGNNGTILRTTNGGFTPVSEEIKLELPEQYLLSQNFPNPFNPSTKIKFTIPDVGTALIKFVQIKVYDILGSEIATLVNEEKPAGNYEVEFDGSNLSSGVYFYRMQAGNFIETKKFVLMK